VYDPCIRGIFFLHVCLFVNVVIIIVLWSPGFVVSKCSPYWKFTYLLWFGRGVFALLVRASSVLLSYSFVRLLSFWWRYDFFFALSISSSSSSYSFCPVLLFRGPDGVLVRFLQSYLYVLFRFLHILWFVLVLLPVFSVFCCLSRSTHAHRRSQFFALACAPCNASDFE